MVVEHTGGGETADCLLEGEYPLTIVNRLVGMALKLHGMPSSAPLTICVQGRILYKFKKK